MTLDEAILEMDQSRDYLVYRDAESDKVSVLVIFFASGSIIHNSGAVSLHT